MEDAEFKCEVCEDEFASKADLKKHMQDAHKSSGYTCELCPKVFFREPDLLEHFNSAHKSDYNRHTCHICGVSYKWFKFLEHHIKKIHKVESLIQCPKCGEEFYNSLAFQKHTKLKHVGGRPFHKCSKCFRSFTAKTFVQLHDKFDHDPGGLKHFQAYVNENLNLDDKELTTSMKRCVRCNLEFSSAMYLFKHLKYVHNKKTYYKCCKCNDAVYCTRAGLTIHLHFEHGVSRGHKCNKCMTKYSKLTKSIARKLKVKAEKAIINNTEEKFEENQPPWSKLFVKDVLPSDVELNDATEVELKNLKSNIKNLFTILSTVPPSKLVGNVSRDLATESVFSFNKFKGGQNDSQRKYNVLTVDEKVAVVMSTIDEIESKKTGKVSVKEEATFVCNDCGSTFAFKESLIEHIQEEHETKHHANATNATEESNYGFSYEDVDESSLVNNEDLGFDYDTIPIVIEQIDDDIELQARYSETETRRSYKCNACETEYEDQLQLLNHLTECHINVENKMVETVYKCVTCSSAFRTEETLNEHMKYHLVAKREILPSICDRCDRSFIDKRALTLHRYRSHGMKNLYACKTCDFKHSNKRMLRGHICVDNYRYNFADIIEGSKNISGVTDDIMDLTENENIEDESLDTTTNDMELYNGHEESTSTETALETSVNIAETSNSTCDKENARKTPEIDYQKMKYQLLKMCKKEIEQKKGLQDPKRVYKCLKCDNRFPKRALLLAHIKNDHKIHLFKLHKCDKCFAVFKMEDKLKQHIKLKHKTMLQATGLPIIKINKSKLSPIKMDNQKLPNILSSIFHNCKICHSYFPSSELLQRHIQWEHTKNVNLHKCGQCNQVLFTVEDLELHMNTTHNKEDKKIKWKKQIVINYEQQTDV
ncbi:unnamed protein product [Plutella xylostella]|uniref:(diamondback moth) hypothetical protein n=1 Tax=Plutella xylostella TaxID=51655 RepID=A0A8S4FYX5_PLUXY|nr:unnamed protein product [Plutella xylostella]